MKIPHRFNSTLVRLEGCNLSIRNSPGNRFNSTLVRLEDTTGLVDKDKYYVSIPLWFDWKFHPFQAKTFVFLRFNSTLVRLEE